MSQYKVVETFTSINGEGVLAGQLAVFVRFQGCNLACSYCDTAWANQDSTAYSILTEQQIYQLIKKTGVKNVTLTGGEPLLVPDIMQLLELLAADSNLHVEIETNGSIDLLTFTKISNRPVFTMDYKLPGSLMESKMLVSNFKLLTKNDVVKFVVGSIEDLNCARKTITMHHLITKCHVYISTVFGKIGLDEVVEYMKANCMNGVTLQLQMHKVIWDPDKRGI
ncbi:putative 7-carboxy-7-deazaguanine synthase QueE [Anaerocolumna sp. MB42-C2]|uniref:putative 7-carboxy-7-deazaguanine synthase QueE n=1 Tax=Anaerocolumna sp. MB42-C2 TaxID=3070997 RepID=UPI0027DF6F1A|nr:putative 7-carboxy-7-deazaguanine synthase QueE [Anaerocolumna sp. MB42-C2]WMJ89708.1 putative 7-carboxy-7-deazaguanine synthase QueE [Anaerocolumna sp. MB42-C2]